MRSENFGFWVVGGLVRMAHHTYFVLHRPATALRSCLIPLLPLVTPALRALAPLKHHFTSIFSWALSTVMSFLSRSLRPLSLQSMSSFFRSACWPRSRNWRPPCCLFSPPNVGEVIMIPTQGTRDTRRSAISFAWPKRRLTYSNRNREVILSRTLNSMHHRILFPYVLLRHLPETLASRML